MRALLVVPLLLVAACGSDDDSGGGGGGDADPAAFCEQVAVLQATTAPDEDVDLDEFQALIDVAPSEVSGSLTFLRDVFVQIEEAGDDEEALLEIFSLVDDPDFAEANATINEYVADECGIDLEAADE
ncbi:MAG: hypothetical protein AAGF73_08330 [Actinomycetota bacterium]